MNIKLSWRICKCTSNRYSSGLFLPLSQEAFLPPVLDLPLCAEKCIWQQGVYFKVHLINICELPPLQCICEQRIPMQLMLLLPRENICLII